MIVIRGLLMIFRKYTNQDIGDSARNWGSQNQTWWNMIVLTRCGPIFDGCLSFFSTLGEFVFCVFRVCPCQISLMGCVTFSKMISEICPCFFNRKVQHVDTHITHWFVSPIHKWHDLTWDLVFSTFCHQPAKKTPMNEDIVQKTPFHCWGQAVVSPITRWAWKIRFRCNAVTGYCKLHVLQRDALYI